MCMPSGEFLTPPSPLLLLNQPQVLRAEVPGGGLEGAQEGVQAAGLGVHRPAERICGRQVGRGAVRGSAAGVGEGRAGAAGAPGERRRR